MSEVDTQRLGSLSGRWIVSVAVALAALTCAAIAYVVEVDQKNPTLRFPDGAEQRILAVTYGKTHRWRRQVPPIQWLSSLFGRTALGDVVQWDSPTPVMVVWPERRANVNPTRYVLRDEHGCQFKPGRGWFEPTDPIEVRNRRNGISDPDAEVFEDFPRSSKTLTLEATCTDGQLASVEFANPVGETVPSFSAPALPGEGTVDDLTVSAKRVFPSAFATGGLEIELEMREGGNLTNGWRVVRYAIMDATGNRLEGDPSLDSGRNLAGIVNLCARVPWRLRLDLLPTLTPTRPPDHLVHYSLWPLPRKGKRTEGKIIARAGDLNLHLNAISRETLLDGIPSRPSAWLAVGNCRGPILLAADPKVDRKGKTRWGSDFIVDDYRSSNRRHQPYPAAVWLVRYPNEDYSFPLSRSDVKSRTLRIGVYRPRTVELTFTPQP